MNRDRVEPSDRTEHRTEHCHRCATPWPGAGPQALAWACEREPDGRQRRLCPDCARRHARDIEARLAPEWW